MGKLTYSMSISLDGFVETPSRSLDWVNVDEELHAFFNDEARAMSASLYGRRLDELMADYWPTAETDPSATPMMLETRTFGSGVVYLRYEAIQQRTSEPGP